MWEGSARTHAPSGPPQHAGRLRLAEKGRETRHDTAALIGVQSDRSRRRVGSPPLPLCCSAIDPLSVFLSLLLRSAVGFLCRCHPPLSVCCHPSHSLLPHATPPLALLFVTSFSRQVVRLVEGRGFLHPRVRRKAQPAGRRQLYDCHSSPERHGHAPPGARADQRDRGRGCEVPPNVRQGDAVEPRVRPRWDRHPNGELPTSSLFSRGSLSLLSFLSLRRG